MDKLALFDIDKTLIKNSSGHRESFSYSFKEVYGVNTSIDIIEPAGMTDQQIILKVLKLNGLSEYEIKSKINQCMELMSKAFLNKYRNNKVEILDGVEQLLNIFEKNNILMGLVTGNLELIGRGKMEKFNLNHFFKVSGFGSDHENRTELVKIAIKQAEDKYNFIFDNNVFLFGDTPEDVKSGIEAGVMTIGVATGIYSKNQLEKAGATKVFNNLVNTKEILKYILG